MSINIFLPTTVLIVLVIGLPRQVQPHHVHNSEHEHTVPQSPDNMMEMEKDGMMNDNVNQAMMMEMMEDMMGYNGNMANQRFFWPWFPLPGLIPVPAAPQPGNGNTLAPGTEGTTQTATTMSP